MSRDSAASASTPPARHPSVVFRLGAWIAAIASLAAISIFASITVAELSSGEARAINIAGSLRMQTYAIGAALAQNDPGGTDQTIAEFEQRYASPALTSAIPTRPDDPLRIAYDRVGAQWRQVFQPASQQAKASLSASLPAAPHVSAETTELVGAINGLVVLIEQGLEAKLQTLRLVQAISLAMLVLVAAGAVLQLKKKVIHPLRDLLDSADRVRRGDFAVRVPIREHDELGQLGESFNFMVEDLSHSYAHLENRVREKTEALARSNQSLNLLYRTTRALSERAVTHATLRQVLADVEQVIGATAGTICLGKDGDATQVLASDVAGAPVSPVCPPDCPGCATPGQPLPPEADPRVVSVPLFDGSRSHGALRLVLADGQRLAPWQTELLEAVGRHIGSGLTSTQRNEERHRLAVLDERSVIARELHDSLAQSLSYLKIQVTRLQTMLRRAPPSDQVTDIVGELRDGLNEAYRQLRELLTTFRLRIDGRGLHAAIDETVQEFRRRTGIETTLANDLTATELAANREIHVLQIIREALSNIEHHARASHVAITLRQAGPERLRVTVDDDGVGIDEAARRVHRYGIVIMRDRAQSLAGELAVRQRPGGGTRVELDFPVDAVLNDPHQHVQGNAP